MSQPCLKLRCSSRYPHHSRLMRASIGQAYPGFAFLWARYRTNISAIAFVSRTAPLTWNVRCKSRHVVLRAQAILMMPPKAFQSLYTIGTEYAAPCRDTSRTILQQYFDCVHLSSHAGRAYRLFFKLQPCCRLHLLHLQYLDQPALQCSYRRCCGTLKLPVWDSPTYKVPVSGVFADTDTSVIW